MMPAAPEAPAADSPAPAETSITNAVALELLDRYLAPLGSSSRIDIQVELDAVVSLLSPESDDTWTWDIQPLELQASLATLLRGDPVKGFSTNVEVEVSEWDTDLGDGTLACGYCIAIKMEIKQS